MAIRNPLLSDPINPGDTPPWTPPDKTGPPSVPSPGGIFDNPAYHPFFNGTVWSGGGLSSVPTITGTYTPSPPTAAPPPPDTPIGAWPETFPPGPVDTPPWTPPQTPGLPPPTRKPQPDAGVIPPTSLPPNPTGAGSTGTGAGGTFSGFSGGGGGAKKRSFFK